MKSRKGSSPKYVRSFAAFAVMLAMFGGISLYVFVVQPEVRDELLPPVQLNETETVFEVFPGKLSYVTEEEVSKSISFADLQLDNALKVERLLVDNNFIVYSSAFNQESAQFLFSVDPSGVRQVSFDFVVYEAPDKGKLNIDVNGKSIFSRSVSVGEKVTVSVPFDYLKESGTNRVKIKSSSPGVAFWKKNKFNLFDFNLVTEEYNSDSSSAHRTFSLTSSEASSMEDAKLTAYFVKKSDSPANVEIKLNNVRIFEATPDINIELDIPEGIFRQGVNTFTWSVERDGAYEVKFIKLRASALEDSGRMKKYAFTLSDALNAKARSSDYSCDLTLVRGGGSSSLDVNLNSDSRTYDFSSNVIVVDVCSDLEPGRNFISFSSTLDEIDLESAKLTISNE